MTMLKALADARPEIFKAEVAALLHDLGKLNNLFIVHFAEDAPKDSSYHVERVVQPHRVILIEQAKKEIESLAAFDLALRLLSDFDWGIHTTVATTICDALRQRAKAGSPPFGADGIRRWLLAAVENISDVESSWIVLSAVYGACKLRDLLLETPSPGHRYPYEQLLDNDVQFLGETRLSIASDYSLGELITLIWDEFHIREHKPIDTADQITDEYNRLYNEYARRDALTRWIGKATFLPRYLITCHGSVRGMEGSGVRKQLKDNVFSTSAYGCEAFRVPNLDTFSSKLLAKLSELVVKIRVSNEWGDLISVYREITYVTDKVLAQALGDTRRPDNDINLQDYSSSIAAFYKASLAKAILEQHFVEPHELRWRLLHLSFDGPAFWGQAHHVTDLLGRRRALEDGLDAVRQILEVQYPLGNEVYRDEHGSAFVVPDRSDLLHLKDDQGKVLNTLLENAFDAKGIRGELRPEIRVSGPYEGKKIDLAGVLQNRRKANEPRLEALANWWSESQRPKNARICTVCARRPVGYPEQGSPIGQDLELDPWADQQKAEQRHVCRVCLNRRGRRSRGWARNEKRPDEKCGTFERTIWTEEVADDNGRFALVVGRFVLDGWLDGKLIPTMLKSPSFARIRRCWDTTRQFWREVERDLIAPKVGQRLRLGIRPNNVERLNNQRPGEGLGKWHTYEAEIRGRRLGLCWDPNDAEIRDRNLFWTTDNIRYLGQQLGFRAEDLKSEQALADKWKKLLDGRNLSLYEPGGYLGQDRRVDFDAQSCVVVNQNHFYPFIPVTAEPATFMSLVPADKALMVARAIKAKYDAEMARVRDRLPLHLGLVFASRRTPLAAVLEAGRAMLKMPDQWEKWRVNTRDHQARFSRNGHEFEWIYPPKMGDGKTDDVWYPHLLTVDPVDPRTKGTLSLGTGDFQRVDKFTGPSAVYIRPSRFDFEFLDTTARRFQICYDDNGRRPRHTRPFLLDDLDRLEELWQELCHLKKSQRHQVIASIEAAREQWFGEDNQGKSWNDSAFRQFVSDTLAGAAWPKNHTWKTICQRPVGRKLVDAGVTGELADMAELHLEILKE